MNLMLINGFGGNKPRADFTPASVSGLQLWLDAMDLSLSDGNPVTSWTDLSGTGNTVTQGTGANQPTYRATAFNGKPTVDFDGSTDVLINSSPTNLIGINEFTMFYVFEESVLTANHVPASVDSSSGTQLSWIVLVGGTRKPTILASTNGTGTDIVFDTTQTVTTNEEKILMMQWEGTGGNYETQFKGSTLTGTTGTGTLFNSSAGLAIGARRSDTPIQHWNGNISEMIMYNRKTTSAETTQITNYLQNKWGVT